MRSCTLMVRSAATPRVSNHEAIADCHGFTFQTARRVPTRLRDLAARPARVLPEFPVPCYQRAQGMPGARCTRSLVCDKKQTHERSHHGHTGNHPAFPAQWFYGLLRALPGDQACLTPSPALLIADLTPASRRQNDTTWPYASALFVNCAAASTASRPAFVTIASRPSVGRDGRGYIADLGLLASKISEIPK